MKRDYTTYPTWAEWQETVFPDHMPNRKLLPCEFMQVDCRKHTCENCYNSLIPKEIAVKLGIKRKNE